VKHGAAVVTPNYFPFFFFPSIYSVSELEKKVRVGH